MLEHLVDLVLGEAEYSCCLGSGILSVVVIVVALAHGAQNSVFTLRDVILEAGKSVTASAQPSRSAKRWLALGLPRDQ
jgi:hypothetical protein